jgi:hypothetical protein
MGGIFSKPKAPAYVPPPAPSAPVEEATFKPGANENDTNVNRRKMGKKRLQIPSGTTTTATTASGLATGV